jgi:hypothetical protein
MILCELPLPHSTKLAYTTLLSEFFAFSFEVIELCNRMRTILSIGVILSFESLKLLDLVPEWDPDIRM